MDAPEIIGKAGNRLDLHVQVGCRKRRFQFRLIPLLLKRIHHRPAGFLKALCIHELTQTVKGVADRRQFGFSAVVPQHVMREHDSFVLHPAIHVRADPSVAACQPVPPQIMPP